MAKRRTVVVHTSCPICRSDAPERLRRARVGQEKVSNCKEGRSALQRRRAQKISPVMIAAGNAGSAYGARWPSSSARPYIATRAGSDSPPAGRRRFHVFSSKPLQLSFSKPLHATECQTRLRAFRILGVPQLTARELSRSSFPRMHACRVRVPQLFFLRRSAASRERICFALADQLSWLVAVRRAQRR
jgi:hypothetical protein